MASSSSSSAETAGLADIGGGPRSASQASAAASSPPQGSSGEKPQWLLQLERALQRNGKDAHSRYVQLATVGEETGEDGSTFVRPFVRTVVYRGVVPAATLGKREEEEGGQVCVRVDKMAV